MDTDKSIQDVLEKKDWLLKENSNTQVTPSLMDLHLASQAIREYALKHLYSKEVTRAHLNNVIYIHDLHSVFRPYCNGQDPRIFLLDGLKFPHCRSKPAKHFSSAVYQSMAFMFYSQLFFAGAQAMDYYNWFLAPYLHYDRLKYKEVKQIIQGFIFQLNESNRTGAQSAFTNIGLRIKCPSYLKEVNGEPVKVIYAGKKLDDCYENYEEEARTIYKAIMEVMGEGDGNNLPFTFPIITTAITKDLEWDDELIETTMKTTTKTGAPYFFNLTTDYLHEKYVHAMCCRLLVEHSGGVWNASGIGTGSNKVVTINLPHLGVIAKNEKHFFTLLDKALEITRKALLEGNKIIWYSLNKWKLLPFLKMKTDEGIPYYNYKERKLTFGVIGMDDCLHNLIGVGITSSQGFKLALKIIRYISKRIEEFSKKDGVSYTLEQTPAESATYKLALQDRTRFGKRAYMRGRGDKVYYTNSTHVPYSEDLPLKEKVEIEAEFHPYFSGGVISHIWIGESQPNPEAMKNLVKKLSKTKLAYFTFSPDYSKCKNGHVLRGVHKRCPKCRANIINHINRIVGYFSRTSNWNPGKLKEFYERKRILI